MHCLATDRHSEERVSLGNFVTVHITERTSTCTNLRGVGYCSVGEEK